MTSKVDEKKEKLISTESSLIKKDSKAQEPQEKAKTVSYFTLQCRYATSIDFYYILLGCIGALGNGSGLPLMSFLLGDTINKIDPINKSDDYLDTIGRLCMMYVYVGAGLMICSAIMVFGWTMAGKRLVARLKQEYFSTILKQEQSWFDQINAHEFATKVEVQTKIIESGLGDKVGNCIYSISTCLMAYVVGFITSWKLSLVLISTLPFLAIGGYCLTQFMIGEDQLNRQFFEKAGGVAEEIFYYIKTVVSFGNFRYEIDRFMGLLRESKLAGIKSGLKAAAVLAFTFFIMYGSYALAFWYGSLCIANGDTNWNTGKPFGPGDVLTVIFSIVFGSYSLGQASPNFSAISKACQAASELFTLVDRNPNTNLENSTEKPDKSKLEGRILFNDVSFTYPTRQEQKIFDGLNLKIEPGKSTAIVGESGSGKSTIVNLIERLYDPDSGNILLDNYDTKALDLEYFRSLIGYVAQEPVLFNTSIRENIIFGRENVTDEEIKIACENAYVTEFVSKIPEGTDYIVGIKGSKLSGGQKQRVAIARAILKRPKILILDEATSALDTKSEKEIQNAIDKISKKGITTIIIAHRLSTIINADKIVVLDKGKVAEIGTHSELLALDQIYARLVQSQLAADADTSNRSIRLSMEKKLSSSPDSGRRASLDAFENPPPLLDEKKEEEVFMTKEQLAKKEEEEKEKEKERKKEEEEFFSQSQKKLISLLGEIKWVVVFAVIFSAINGGAWPMYGFLMAGGIENLSLKDPEEIKKKSVESAVYFIILAASTATAAFFQSYLFSRIGETIAYSLRSQVFEKLLRFHMGFFDNPENTPGSLLAKLSSDTTKINGVALTMIGVYIQTIFTLLLGITLGVYFDWRLALITIAFIPLIIMSSALEFQLQSGYSEGDSKLMAEAGSVLSESVINTKTIFSYNMQEKVKIMYKQKLSSGDSSLKRKSIITGCLYGFSNFVSFGSYAVLYWAGANWVFDGSLLPGDMNRAIFIVLFAAFGVGMVQLYVGDYSKAKTALVNIYRILEAKSEIDPLDNDETKRVADLKGKIEFKNVTFAYPARPDQIVLKNLSFTIQPGQAAAFVGFSGSGKSTIVQLIERFYDPLAGEILIDDINIKNYNINEYRKQVGIVLQEPILFKRSVIENIRYGRLDCTDAEIREASVKAYINNIAMSENLGKDSNVSGGQKQRICIARAIIKNPKVMLFDEATSALDKVSEEIVQKALDELMVDRTSVVIAHRLSTIVNSDVIFVLESGELREQGTHEELLEKKGKYFNLYNTFSGKK